MLHDPWAYSTLLLLIGYIILGGFVARFVWTLRSVRKVTRKKSRVVTDPTGTSSLRERLKAT